MSKACDVNAFIRDPTATKQIYDAVQVVHPKTLSACSILAMSTSKAHPYVLFCTKLDPRGELQVPQLLELLRQHMIAYRALVLLDHVDPGMTVKKTLSI
jgi:hypothetical protein